jgi:hypothetical protein
METKQQIQVLVRSRDGDSDFVVVYDAPSPEELEGCSTEFVYVAQKLEELGLDDYSAIEMTKTPLCYEHWFSSEALGE